MRMKTKKMNLRMLALSIIALVSLANATGQTLTKTFTFDFAPEDFEFSGEEEIEILPGMKFYEEKEIIFHYGKLGTPALLYFEYPILIPDNYRMKDFTYSLVDEATINQVVSGGNTLTVDNITLKATPLEVSGPGPHPEVPEYHLITYPAEVVHTGNIRYDGYKPEMFEINPFTYHAADRKLVLATSITLTITIEPDSSFEIPDGRDDDAIKNIKYYVHNLEDVESGIENWKAYLPNMANEYKQNKTTCIKFLETSLLCTAPNAVKLEVYTMDAIKVGEARFVDGEATVKVGQAPAMYLYVVTYPDGRRESGKAMISEE